MASDTYPRLIRAVSVSGTHRIQDTHLPGRIRAGEVFTIPTEFCPPREDIAELALGVERAVFEKPENPGAHMKPLFIRGHLDRTSIGRMLIDGGASVNILMLSLFKKLGRVEGDLKRTNLSLSGFAGDPTEAKGITCKGVTVGSKTVPTTFFVVDVKGRYNVLLRRDWIHANECVSCTLHQWIGDEVEVVQADEEVCFAVAESQVDILGGKMECLSGKDLTGYDYISRNPFKMYIAAQERVFGAVLLQEEDGKEFPVTYVSRRLLDAETRYIFVEKLCLSLYYARSKFRHYILSSSCTVSCQYDVIKHMLLMSILSGMMGKWAYTLVEYDLAYESLRSMKGQVVADFIVDHAVDLDHSVNFFQLKPWGLYFDGWVCNKGQGSGCVVVSPSGVYIDLSIRLEFVCTNNQVEYEYLCMGLSF
jgi:hypothetical protein